MTRYKDEDVRNRRVLAVMNKYNLEMHVAESWIKAWYRGQNNKRRHLANAAIVEAGLVFDTKTKTLLADMA